MNPTEKVLRQLAQETITRCCFQKETNYGGVQKTRTVFLPAGDEKYHSFWPVDTIFSARCGLMPTELLKEAIDIIFTYGQNGEHTIPLKNGLEISPFAIADHVNFDGKPVYFPGTYSSGEEQGVGKYGYLPPLNNLYLICELVKRYIDQSGNRSVLENCYDGVPLKTRLENSFYASYAIDEDTQLCCGKDEPYVVDFTYCDQVVKTGLFLVPSVMRAEAAVILADFSPEKQNEYRALSHTIIQGVVHHLFDTKSGWFYSATGKCHQWDVWGTAYAVYSNLLPLPVREKACNAILQAYKNGSACCNGYVRHILTTADYAEDSAWESAAICKYNEYQNGGYWATPSGWIYYALALCDSAAAQDFLNSFVQFYEDNREDGAPYEWFHPQSGMREGRRYGTSGTALWAALEHLKSSASTSLGQ